MVAWSALALLLTTVGWWAWSRLSAPGDRLVVVRPEEATAAATSDPETIRILAWNIAHGRGDTGQEIWQNWMGGSESDRLERLERIGDALRAADADVVALNEVDFDAGWSYGLNQAAFLAERAGYPYRVEQRNFDVQTPFERWAFGNSLLSRFPIDLVEWVDLPAHSQWESVALGSKEAAVVRLRVGEGSLAVVPVHLEYRQEDTRLRAVSILEALRAREPAPMVLAGDFNTAPPGWPGVDSTTALGELLERGWRSGRTERPASPAELTYPTYDLGESRDWILVEPPLEVVEARVVEEAAPLSDHAPVLAVIRRSMRRGPR